MESKQLLTTLPKQISSKTILLENNPNLKGQIREYFLNTYSVYEKLFEVLNSDEAYYIRAEPLRHPLIFYFGHTATVYVNKFIDHGIIKNRINEQYEKMFAVGVDQMDWDDLNQCHYKWPSVSETRVYRESVKQMILETIENLINHRIDNWLSNLWVVMLGIEHERIHLETSAVIIRRVPLRLIKQIPQFVECPYKTTELQKIPKNTLIDVPLWKSVWNRKKQNPLTYGWDNQFGVKQFDVQSYEAGQMLVSNGEFLEFVLDNGYHKPQYWTAQGKKWIMSIKPKHPLFWRKIDNHYKLRTISQQIDMPWDWPAQVNNLEARAFCKWKSFKTGTYFRLPTEDQYYAMRDFLKKDQTNWDYQQVGNINMEFWMSPNPVNYFETEGFYDIVGNVWQHTITPIYPFKQFQIHPVYQDFTTPTFDQRHDIIKGGSFISTGNEALYHARYAFRRHFYQFAGFRYIKTTKEIQVDIHCQEVISDVNVEMNLKHHYLNDKSYVIEVIDKLKDLVGKEAKNEKILTVGCSVGRIPLQLGRTFGHSIGIDYTTRYFQMSTRLRQKSQLKFKDIDIDLKKLHLCDDQVDLFQMNPQNPDEKKINECDWILIDGFAIRRGKLDIVLGKIIKLAKRNAKIAVLNVSGVNELPKEKIKEILGKAANGQVVIKEQYRLKASDEPQDYLPDCPGQLNFKLNLFQIIQH